MNGYSFKMLFWLSGANSSVKARHLLQVGGYDEVFDLNWGDEDADLGYRLEKIGLRLIPIYNAIIYHQWHPTSMSGTPGHNRVLLILKHPELLKARLLMRRANPYYGKSIEELRGLLGHVSETTKNYY